MNDPSAAATANAPPRRSWPGRAMRVLAAWLVLMVVLLSLVFGWVAFYSYVLDPGHAAAHYEDYAQRATPVVAIVISGPVFGAFGFLCGRRRGTAGAEFARTTAVVFVAIDAAFIAAVAGAAGAAWFVWFAAGTLKIAGAVLGGRIGARAADARK